RVRNGVASISEGRSFVWSRSWPRVQTTPGQDAIPVALLGNPFEDARSIIHHAVRDEDDAVTLLDDVERRHVLTFESPSYPFGAVATAGETYFRRLASFHRPRKSWNDSRVASFMVVQRSQALHSISASISSCTISRRALGSSASSSQQRLP